MSDRDRGPERAKLRLETRFEVDDNSWAVYPNDDNTGVWIDLIGFDFGEWSAKFTPEQTRGLIDALAAAANRCEDA